MLTGMYTRTAGKMLHTHSHRLPLILLVLLIAATNLPAQNNPTQQAVVPDAPDLSPEAAPSDPRAQFILGARSDQQGQYPEALAWYRKSAEQGYSLAQSALGLMYEIGRGVPQDFAEALKWNRLAVAQDNPIAENNLGLMSARGEGMAADPGQARQLFEKSAQNGWPPGQANLAYLYLSGGAKDDVVKAYMWCVLARAAGEQSCANTLNDSIASLSPPAIQEGDDLAFSWFQQRMAAPRANGTVHVNLEMLPVHLGDMYVGGMNVPRNDSAALKWYQWGAGHGNAAAQARLGEMYLMGLGTARDPQQAFGWFRQSAQAGDLRGVRDLGYALLNGSGTAKDVQHGFELVRKAADGGDSEALNLVAYCYEFGLGVPADSTMAVNLYEKGAQSSNLMALNNLAWIYATSDDPALRNPGKALEYAAKAAEGSNHKDPAILDTLAAAYFGQAQYADAIETEKQALALKPGDPGFQARLAKYKQAQGAQAEVK